jgi:hypothetical protein
MDASNGIYPRFWTMQQICHRSFLAAHSLNGQRLPHFFKRIEMNILKLKTAMIFAATILLMAESVCHASLINVLTGSFSNVAAAVANAHPGDTVLIPPGTNVWTQTLNLNSGISIKGSGTNRTVIIDEVPRANNGGQIFMLAGNPIYLTELSNLQLCGGVNNTSYNYFGSVVCSATAKTSWRVDHVLFNGLYAKNIVTYGSAYSVIDHNTFLMRAIAIEDDGYVDGDQLGDQSYVLPPTYGQNSSGQNIASVLYIEDNFFTNIIGAPAGVCDGEEGARVVFRYNAVWNDFFANHGTETGGRWRSERSFEVYGNIFNYSPMANGYPYYTIADIRGGSGVIFSNTANGYTSIVALRNFRSTDWYGRKWYPFDGASGTCPWDSNSPTIYLSGTSSATNGSSYLQVAGANWTNNQWVGYTLVDTNNLAGFMSNLTNCNFFSVVSSNSANTMYYLGTGLVQSDTHPPMTFRNGDQFQLYFVYATLDQPGRGSGDLLVDDGMDSQGNEYVINTAFGVPAYPRQALEPIYCWSNTLNGTPTGMFSPYPGIQSGRDFYNGTPKPNYISFPYPHPLAAIHQLAPPAGFAVATNAP